MCSKEIVLCGQNMLTILCPIVKLIREFFGGGGGGRELYDHLIGGISFCEH